ncbi:hypothetical protein IAR55_000726 [Kwoniella newhampshirensis]|uniref:Uncharacterized protein n=1 Tax=Kwoniella newhampshirensis TaxID=1651941 RepID=A0AAW0Z3P2_9TREE
MDMSETKFETLRSDDGTTCQTRKKFGVITNGTDLQGSYVECLKHIDFEIKQEPDLHMLSEPDRPVRQGLSTALYDHQRDAFRQGQLWFPDDLRGYTALAVVRTHAKITSLTKSNAHFGGTSVNDYGRGLWSWEPAESTVTAELVSHLLVGGNYPSLADDLVVSQVSFRYDPVTIKDPETLSRALEKNQENQKDKKPGLSSLVMDFRQSHPPTCKDWEHTVFRNVPLPQYSHGSR